MNSLLILNYLSKYLLSGIGGLDRKRPALIINFNSLCHRRTFLILHIVKSIYFLNKHEIRPLCSDEACFRQLCITFYIH